MCAQLPVCLLWVAQDCDPLLVDEWFTVDEPSRSSEGAMQLRIRFRYVTDLEIETGVGPLMRPPLLW